MATATDRTRTSRPSRLGVWARTHPVGAFVLLTYALSFPFWLLARLGGGFAAIVVGGLGPPVAAAVVTGLSGGSVRGLLRGLTRWRVPGRYYLFALGLPAALFATTNLVLALLGHDLELSLLPERVPGMLGTFLLVATVGGGLEEIGWRGFALPRSEAVRSPVAATLLVGLAWGLWHVPLYGTPAAVVVPAVLAFFYTWLYNRTGSILLCLLLHASFTPAQDFLLLLPEDELAHQGLVGTTDLVLLGVYVTAAAGLVLLTRGRLGLAGARPPRPATRGPVAPSRPRGHGVRASRTAGPAGARTRGRTSR
ncbi:CPBP family intramembrane glutamic endopeptidase [Georgenia sp. SUBG003]|uniref:CPBP family intramembrane glutamic endopeptidase n=1 Tax=Georgenia sp. SUBG003 TaxID=1497974 RepID=UPI000ABB7C38